LVFLHHPLAIARASISGRPTIALQPLFQHPRNPSA
jgi:hypothetical protein